MPLPPPDPDAVRGLAARLDATARKRLGRSLALRHVAAGDCGGCLAELRLTAATTALRRLGLRFVDSPRHADVLLVSGAVPLTMRPPILRTRAAMADPVWVVALGACAVDGGPFGGGPFGGGPAGCGGLAPLLPVDLVIPGCPPPPETILAGLHSLVAAGLHQTIASASPR